MIDLHLSAFAPRWRFLYVVRIDAYDMCVRIYTSRSANVRAYGACAAAERKKLKRKPR